MYKILLIFYDDKTTASDTMQHVCERNPYAKLAQIYESKNRTVFETHIHADSDFSKFIKDLDEQNILWLPKYAGKMFTV